MRQVLVKVSPGSITVSSGMVTSVTKLALSQFDVAVAMGVLAGPWVLVGAWVAGGGMVGKGTAVKVAGMTEAIWACTVSAAAVCTAASLSCAVSGRLQPTIRAAVDSITITTCRTLRISPPIIYERILMQCPPPATPVLSYWRDPWRMPRWVRVSTIRRGRGGKEEGWQKRQHSL